MDNKELTIGNIIDIINDVHLRFIKEYFEPELGDDAESYGVRINKRIPFALNKAGVVFEEGSKKVFMVGDKKYKYEASLKVGLKITQIMEKGLVENKKLFQAKLAYLS